jgi:hypothetical protein
MLFANLTYAQVEHFYDIGLKYKDGDISLTSVEVRILEEEIESLGQYSAEILSFDDQILNIIHFYIPLVEIFDAFDPETGLILGGYTTYLNETDFILALPYYPDAKEIDLYDPDGILRLTIDVSYFAKEVAVEEIIPPEEVIEEKIPEKIPEIKKPRISRWLLPILFTILILVALILIFFISVILTRKKKKR